MSQSLFTIVTITYNSAKWVSQAIESVLASEFTDFEYIIADDGSTDGTWEIVQMYNDPRIKAYRHSQNIGEYANRNFCLNTATGKYILYIDGDDILYKNALTEYSKYIKAFPDAQGIWGVYSIFFDFIVFPYLFNPKELTRLNFLSLYPITVVGFTDSVFNVNALKNIGGFDERFAIGDTYIKRKFCCQYPVLLVPAGRAFWRRSPMQASNRVRKKYRSFIETYQIDEELIYSDNFPLPEGDKKIAIENFNIRSVKLLVSNTLMKGKITDFFMLRKKLRIPFFHLKYIFKKGNYNYKANASGEAPLYNDYNFGK